MKVSSRWRLSLFEKVFSNSLSFFRAKLHVRDFRISVQNSTMYCLSSVEISLRSEQNCNSNSLETIGKWHFWRVGSCFSELSGIFRFRFRVIFFFHRPRPRSSVFQGPVSHVNKTLAVIIQTISIWIFILSLIKFADFSNTRYVAMVPINRCFLTGV